MECMHREITFQMINSFKEYPKQSVIVRIKKLYIDYNSYFSEIFIKISLRFYYARLKKKN